MYVNTIKWHRPDLLSGVQRSTVIIGCELGVLTSYTRLPRGDHSRNKSLFRFVRAARSSQSICLRYYAVLISRSHETIGIDDEVTYRLLGTRQGEASGVSTVLSYLSDENGN